MRVRFSLAIFYVMLVLPLTVPAQTVVDSLRGVLMNHSKKTDTTLADVLNKMSFEYRWRDFSMSQQYAEQALTVANGLHYERGIANADLRLAHCYWALGDNDLAIKRGMEAAALSERLQLTSILGESFLAIGCSYMDQQAAVKALNYIRRAEKIATESENWDLLSRVYNLRGVVLYIEKKTDSALICYNKALAIIQQKNTSKIQLSQVVSNIGECYAQKDMNLGMTYFDNALAIARDSDSRNNSAEAAILGIVGHVMIKKHDYKAAEKRLLASLRLSRQLGSRRSIRYAYAGLVDLKICEGKPAEALEFLRKYYEVRDSILNVAKTRQIVELESKNELEKKEHAIQLLERDREIKMLWANILTTVLVFVGVLAAVLYTLQEYRDKKNQLILSLEIERLTTRQAELAQKYKDMLIRADAKAIESSDQRLLKRAVEAIENNMKDPAFGVEEMAREVGMSRANLNRKVKAITGLPPSELIRNIRLRKAATLLLNRVDSVSQIGFIVGFEDHSYFSKLFKKQFGVPPSEYALTQEQVAQN
ncbi:MAG TPA: helix-turn-helix domain-containing protein [Cyclobacteriaceae bacterium]|jgi:AraC-like DNA-binding protein|nr:helix-turn-helix domain-containing protein [Cyclobacteriaceae bacterium]